MKNQKNNNVIKLDGIPESLNINTPKYVGRYEIGGSTGMSISFSLSDKPNLVNRFFCKWCLGWKWIDN